MAKPFSPALVGSGLIIAALLAGSAYYTYQTQTMRFKNPAPVVINTSTPALVTTTPAIACAEIDHDLNLTGKNQNFDVTKLAPVEVNVSPKIISNQLSLLVFKEYTAGGRVNEGDKKNERYFGVQSPWFAMNFLKPEANNLGIVTTFNVPGALSDEIGSGNIVVIDGDWYIFSITEFGLGSGVANQSFTRLNTKSPGPSGTVETIKIPNEYAPVIKTVCPPGAMECPSSDTNLNTITNLVGSDDKTLIFEMTNNTSTYIGFDAASDKWSKVPLSTRFVPLTKTVEATIKEKGCLSLKWPTGTMVFTPHFLYQKHKYNSADDPTYLDIYWQPGAQEPLYNWDRLIK